MRSVNVAMGGLLLALSVAGRADADARTPAPMPGTCRIRIELRKTDATEWPSITEERPTLSTDEKVLEAKPVDGSPGEEPPEPAPVSREFTWSLYLTAPGALPCNVSATGRATLDTLLAACGRPALDAFGAHCSEDVITRVTDTHSSNENWGEWSEGLFVDTVYRTIDAPPPPHDEEASATTPISRRRP